MSDQSKLGLGQLITTHQERDAIHVAVAPVVAGKAMHPGEHVTIKEGKATPARVGAIGVVDPFLKTVVGEGETFWLFLYPGSITSLRHEWSHPAFQQEGKSARPYMPEAEKWMRHWAIRNMCYGIGDEQAAYNRALNAGHELSVGSFEDARDHIDNEWWTHWETITGGVAQRDEYFSCGC